MKFFFIFIFIAALAIGILILKNKNSAKIKNNGAETTGKVTEIIQRGKLPFCRFTYMVNGVTYKKKQDIPKHLVKKVLNNTYKVKYQIGNPQNSILIFK